MPVVLRNPVLPGFHPDPSICRVGDDFYLATSTFEWWPGVRLHHSRDLAHWREVGHALTRRSQLDMRGCPNSSGVWAPCLTHADGLFWLLYTNVRNHGAGIVIESPNYLVTAPSIEGPWSEPTYLNSRGFDPSLFHDVDGRKWVVQMQTGELAGDRRFDGILIQELDPATRRLVGRPRRLWEGSPIGITEGPHLLRRGDWVYLVTAEGGTAARHAVTVCRARSLDGPWELHPQNPILTSFGREDLALWSAGHGCLVDTPAGDWYLAHLCQRPLQRPGRLALPREENKSVPLGRETAIQQVRWDDDGWPRLAHGGNAPAVEVEVDLPPCPWPAAPARVAFPGPALPEGFHVLREPHEPDWLRMDPTTGALRLRGRDSFASAFDQGIVARRLCHHRARAATLLRFAPEDTKRSAGLVAYYDRHHWHQFRVTADGAGGAKLGVISSAHDRLSRREVARVPLAAAAAGLHLAMERDGTELRFAWSADGVAWEPAGPPVEATLCGDWVSPLGGFTGTFWGMFCQDLAERSAWAEFAWFDYEGS